MTTYLLHDDALRSPELRHEIAEPIVDPVTFIEHDGTRIIVGSELEAPIFEKREDIVDEFWSGHDFGIDELVKDSSLPVELIEPELVLRALRKLGASSVTVPPGFQLIVADYLRERGIEVVVDPDSWSLRRRRKSPWELEGIERAQRAAETAMLTAARMLGEAEVTRDGRLRFEGEILTAELVRIAMSAELLTQGAESEEVIVQSGDACFGGHELGAGPILPDRPCIVDCFPRDRRTGAHTDMTRTFVPGDASDDVRKMHGHVRTALDIAFESIKPGRSDLYMKVAEYFHEQGIPTQLNHTGNGALREGFSHALGHGVGLEVHERPFVGRRSEELVEGDVIAVEPGLYFEGSGGVRLEDTVIVTPTGAEHFTDPYPYDLEPVGP